MSEGILTREQLEERLATLHRASLELVKNISLETLLERIGVLAMEQVAAQYAAVGVLDEEGKLENFIPIGMTPEAVSRMPHPPVGRGLIGALMNSEDPIRLDNMADDPRSSGFPAHHPAMNSFLGVPIRQGNQQLGQIYLTNKLTAPAFTMEDQQVIEMLANYAAVAITNARFYHQITQRDEVLTRRNENLALLNELATVLAGSDDIKQVLNQVLSRVVEYLRLDVGEVYLRQEDSRILELSTHHGATVERLFTRQQFLYGEGMVGETADSGLMMTLNLEELRENSSLMNGQHLHDDVFYASHIEQILCLPLMGRSGILGVLCVGTCDCEPLEDLEMQFLSSISAWVGMAIENLRINVQQRRLALLEERERIGMDLHDGIIQDIYAVGLTLEHARLLLAENPQASRSRIERAIEDLNSTIRDIRSYILDLRPRKLHEENLVDGLRRLIAEFRANTLIEVNLQSPTTPVKLSGAQALALFHIGQEALANIGKHSGARRVDISLWTTNERVLLEIADDGAGFDTDTTKFSLGHGLSNMQTRARNAGGDLEISSEPGAGTTILVWVPNNAG